MLFIRLLKNWFTFMTGILLAFLVLAFLEPE